MSDLRQLSLDAGAIRDSVEILLSAEEDRLAYMNERDQDGEPGFQSRLRIDALTAAANSLDAAALRLYTASQEND